MSAALQKTDPAQSIAGKSILNTVSLAREAEISQEIKSKSFLSAEEFISFLIDRYSSMANSSISEKLPDCLKISEIINHLSRKPDNLFDLQTELCNYLSESKNPRDCFKIYPYLYQSLKASGPDAKYHFFNETLKLPNSEQDKKDALMNLVFMSSDTSAELCAMADWAISSESRFLAKSVASSFIAFRYVQQIFSQNKLPNRKSGSKRISNARLVADYRCWLKTIREQIRTCGSNRSNKMVKLYLEIIDSNRAYLRRGLKRFVSDEDRRVFLDSLALKIRLEFKYALRIDLNDKKNTCFRPWLLEQLKVLEKSLKILPPVLVIGTPKLHRIFLGTAKESWNSKYDNMGVRGFNGAIGISRHSISSHRQKEMEHGGHGALKSTLLHEIGHSIQLAQTGNTTVPGMFDPFSAGSNYLFDQISFLKLTGWKFIAQNQFTICENKQAVRIGNQIFPLNQACSYESKHTMFYLIDKAYRLANSEREKYLLYQTGERHFNQYGSTLPIEQFAVSFVDYFILPIRLLESSPAVFLLLDNFFRRYATETRNRAFKILNQKHKISDSASHTNLIIDFGSAFSLTLLDNKRFHFCVQSKGFTFQHKSPELLTEIIHYGHSVTSSSNNKELAKLQFMQRLCELVKEDQLKVKNIGKEHFLSVFLEKEFSSMSFVELRKLINLSSFGSSIKVIHSQSTELLAFLMLRFQEYYESPQFKGKPFELEEFKNWYKASQGKNHFGYYNDWAGFNFPDTAVAPFLKGFMGQLSEGEKVVLSGLSDLTEKFYVLGVQEDENGNINFEYLRHELSHAFFYLFPDYKKNASAILSNVNLTPLKDHLIKIGYSKKTLLDECIAYLIDGEDSYKQLGLKTTPRILNAINLLQELWKEQFSEISDA